MSDSLGGSRIEVYVAPYVNIGGYAESLLATKIKNVSSLHTYETIYIRVLTAQETGVHFVSNYPAGASQLFRYKLSQEKSCEHYTRSDFTFTAAVHVYQN